MKLIALSGKMTSGKSTVADYLVEVYGFKKLSFARALRLELEEAGFRNVWDKPTLPHVRELLIAWGKARRVENPDYWVWRVRSRLKRAASLEESQHQTEPCFVVDDMRFQNELSMLLDFGAISIRVTKDDPLRPMNPPASNDSSECDLDAVPFDRYLEAEAGDVKGLLECAGQLFNQMEL